MTIFDDEPQRKKVSHEIGCDLYLLSVGELDARIALLKSEIERLEADKISKSASRSAAEDLFKK